MKPCSNAEKKPGFSLSTPRYVFFGYLCEDDQTLLTAKRDIINVATFSILRKTLNRLSHSPVWDYVQFRRDAN